ncbi:EAL domain-containing protein [Desulfovibrio sp. JC010]|uniref:EAL domain-containing protein n=1 Tax=Desulfovibrio sp. JC010 TaxID=2593641 RepID=UPI0013D0E591|nr:EAL domain-containing protein [Desulfovibrio sp. JC010]NDV26347.1 EAL domain-containing protein [Desulfovibrio sp. JC010]
MWLDSINLKMDRVASLTFFRVLKRSQLQIFPLIVVGAVFLCILNLPLQNFSVIISDPLRTVLEDIVNGTYGVAALVLLCSMSYNFGVMHNKNGSGEYASPNLFVVIALSCFFILHGDINFATFSEIASLGKGIAQAFFVASLSSYLLHKFIELRLRVPVSGAGYDLFSREVLALIPACVAVILIFALLKKLMLMAGFTNFHELKQHLILLAVNFTDSEFLNGLLYTVSSQLLWFFGAHGPNTLSFFDSALFAKNMDFNMAAIHAGSVPPHILTKGFLDCFTMVGGSGLTLSLIIAILLKGSDSGVRRISMFALLVCIFNVNEPLLFGIPLILNPIYAIPFILTPVLTYCIAYAVTLAGLVPVITNAVHWTTPALLNVYQATGSWSGVLLQLFVLAVGVGAYMPFVVIFDRVVKKQYEQGMSEVLTAARRTGEYNGYKCLGLPGFEGFVARSLAHDLVNAIRHEEQLYMVYQPQVDVEAGRIIGAEALLRWKHPSYGHISPEVVVALAEDMNCIDQLSYFVLRESCSQLSVWHERFGKDFFVSVNFTPSLFADEKLDEKVISCLRAAQVPANCLEIEITESIAMTSSDRELENLNRLRERGVCISIDDFGMGHTSLRYLRELPIDKVKIDRSLTFGSLNDVNKHIVSSILELCRNINMKVVVEGVEEPEQLEQLREMGGSCFQGYYFSRPLPGEECMCFMGNWGCGKFDQLQTYSPKELGWI